MDFENYFPLWNDLNTTQKKLISDNLITHKTIANHLGSHREVITRMLRYFQGEGIVKLSRT